MFWHKNDGVRASASSTKSYTPNDILVLLVSVDASDIMVGIFGKGKGNQFIIDYLLRQNAPDLRSF